MSEFRDKYRGEYLRVDMDAEDLAAFYNSIHRLPKRSPVLSRALNHISRYLSEQAGKDRVQFTLTAMEAVAIDAAYFPSATRYRPRSKARAMRGKQRFNELMHEQNVSIAPEKYKLCLDHLK